MKKLLIFLCAMSLVFGVVGVAGATLYTEQYSGFQGVEEGETYEFGFCFWCPSTCPYQYTTSSLANVQDAIGAFDPWENMSASVTLYSIDLAWEKPEIEIVAHTYGYGDVVIDLWSALINPNLFTGMYYTYEYDFTPEQVDMWETNGAGTIFITALDTPWYNYNDFGITDVTMELQVVPEPATMLLFGSGLIGLAVFGRKKLFKRG